MKGSRICGDLNPKMIGLNNIDDIAWSVGNDVDPAAMAKAIV